MANECKPWPCHTHIDTNGDRWQVECDVHRDTTITSIEDANRCQCENPSWHVDLEGSLLLLVHRCRSCRLVVAECECTQEEQRTGHQPLVERSSLWDAAYVEPSMSTTA